MSIMPQDPDSKLDPPPCTTMGCPNLGTIFGIYDDGDERARVNYCPECAGYLYQEFTPEGSVGVEEMTEAGALRVRLQSVEHDLEHVVVERDRAEAALRRVEALAAELEQNLNWREWGIHRRIRRAIGGATLSPESVQP